jgi:NADH:ubiquinone oxidoreductase subunit D
MDPDYVQLKIGPGVHVGTRGDRDDLYCIRIEEMPQRLWIIWHCPNKMPR